MAKDPVLPLYYNDIDSATKTWTDEEFGAYMRLLIFQWDKGGLPKDYQRLTRIATSLDTNWIMIQKKFAEVEGLLKNPVMEEIRLRRIKHKEKQRENIAKRYQTPTKPDTGKPSKRLPLENENEIEKEKSYKELNEAEFSELVFGFKEKYSDEMLAGFLRYWKEKDSRGKMKFQKQATWELNLRIETWYKSPYNKTNGTNKQSISGGSKTAGQNQLIESLRVDLESGT